MKFPPRSTNGEGPSHYLKIKDGESVTGILRGELYKYWQTGFGPTAQIVGPGEGKERFRHNIVVKDGDHYVAKVWEFGPKIYDTLSALDGSGWDLANTLLTISRAGSTKENTKYTVTPNKKEPSVAAMKEIEKLELINLGPKEQGPLKNYAPGADDSEVPF
jgi:hypothetical protein